MKKIVIFSALAAVAVVASAQEQGRVLSAVAGRPRPACHGRICAEAVARRAEWRIQGLTWDGERGKIAQIFTQIYGVRAPN